MYVLKFLKPEQRSSIIFVKSFCPHRSCSLCSPMAWAALHTVGVRCRASVLKIWQNIWHVYCTSFEKALRSPNVFFLKSHSHKLNSMNPVEVFKPVVLYCQGSFALLGWVSLAILNPEVSKWSQDVALVARLSDQNHAWYIFGTVFVKFEKQDYSSYRYFCRSGCHHFLFDRSEWRFTRNISKHERCCCCWPGSETLITPECVLPVCKGPERDGINSSLCTPGSSQKGATPRQVKSTTRQIKASQKRHRRKKNEMKPHKVKKKQENQRRHQTLTKL